MQLHIDRMCPVTFRWIEARKQLSSEFVPAEASKEGVSRCVYVHVIPSGNQKMVDLFIVKLIMALAGSEVLLGPQALAFPATSAIKSRLVAEHE